MKATAESSTEVAADCSHLGPSLHRLAHRTIKGLGRWYERRVNRNGERIDGRVDRGLRAMARLYARTQLPGHIAMLEALLVNRPRYWRDAGVASCRGCWHGYRLRLDLTDYFQRWAYFLSRYHELGVQILMRKALRSGDTFVDGGANNGLVSLLGAWVVGPSGKVFAFEPNPTVIRQLRWHVRVNRVSQVQIIPRGLSDAETELEFAVPGRDNLGAGTFAPLPDRYGGYAQARCRARTMRGDDALADVPGPMMIKLDVEGFEVKALHGLRATLERLHPLVIAEANSEMLNMAGTDLPTLCGFMDDLGYLAYAADAVRVGLRRRGLVLRPYTLGEDAPWDLVWIHPDSIFAERLRRYILA